MFKMYRFYSCICIVHIRESTKMTLTGVISSHRLPAFVIKTDTKFEYFSWARRRISSCTAYSKQEFKCLHYQSQVP